DMPSATQLGDGQGGLDQAMMRWFRGHYVKDPALVADLRLSPLRNPDFSRHPATIMVTATDPLRDEGLAYSEKLKAAGIAVTHLDYPALVHGFVTMGGAIPAARRAVEAICRETRQRL
ncbi:alpha/beta hydrolase, partial [Vibrio agarivorans]